MTFSFLFSYKTLSNALSTGRAGDFPVVCAEALDIAFELQSLDNSNCSIFSTSQAVDKVEGELTPDRATRLKGAIKTEDTTRGVEGYDPDTSTPNSAKTLSFGGNTIVIASEEDKENIEPNTRIVVMTPAEFIKSYKTTKSLSSLLDLRNGRFIDFMFISMLKPELVKQICDPFNKDEEESE